MKDSLLNKKFRYSYKNSVAVIIGINVILFFLLRYTKIVISKVNLFYWLSLIPRFIRNKCFWQFFTYMFVHLDTIHLVFNMYALVLFGYYLERYIGTKEFLFFYLLSGTLSGICGYVFYTISGNINVVILGASGAIYALMFLTSVFFPQQRLYTFLFLFIPLRMPFAVLLFTILEIAYQLFGSDGTAHLIHLSGFVIAYLYCLMRLRINPVKAWFS